MKVLIINSRIETGSVGRIVSDLYHELKKRGYSCKIAYARGINHNIPQEDTIKICDETEVIKHALLTRLFGNTAFYSKNSTLNFIKKIEIYKPDVIHIHGLYGYYINIDILFKYISKKKIRVISTLHSCWDITGHCCNFEYLNCEQWKFGCLKCKHKHTYPKSSFLDNTRENFNKKKILYSKINDCIIVTPSEWLYNHLKDSLLSNKRAKIIRNGIDLSVFYKRENVKEIYNKYNIDPKKRIILCVANIWNTGKGFKDIIDLSQVIDNNTQIVVVGLIKSKNLNKNIIKINRTNNVEELAKLYSIADIFFNPTYEDNYPTVNLEAIACQTPVITYQTGGSPEIILSTGYGKVIKRRDFNELLKALNNTEMIKCKTPNFEIVSKENMINQYLKLYESKYEE